MHGQHEVGIELGHGVAGIVEQGLRQLGQADAWVGEETPSGLSGGLGRLLGQTGQARVVRRGGTQVLEDQRSETLLEARLQGWHRNRKVILILYA